MQYLPVLTNISSVEDLFILSNYPRAIGFEAVAACILYLTLSDIIFGTIRTTFGLQPKGSVVQAITVSHSMILAVYSGWTFYNSALIAIPYFLEHGFYESLCDTDILWNKVGLGFWITHFYWSKYYEFIDTW
eukprot:gene9472-12761_t